MSTEEIEGQTVPAEPPLEMLQGVKLADLGD